MRLSNYQNEWRQCAECGNQHLDSSRIWIKNYGLDMSSCPACGSVMIAPAASMKRQQDLIFKEAA